MNGVELLFEGNHLQYLLPIINLRFQVLKIKVLGKLLSATVNLTASQELKFFIFFAEIVGDINECDF